MCSSDLVISDDLFDYRESIMMTCLRRYELPDKLIERRSEERREGKSVDLGGRRIIKKKEKKKTKKRNHNNI